MSSIDLPAGEPAGPTRGFVLFGRLAGVEALLLAAFLTSQTGALGDTLRKIFDLDAEQSVGTWFSSAQLLAIAVALWLAGRSPQGEPRPAPWFLWLGAGAFLYLSIDETVSIHEAMTLSARAHASWLVLFPGGHGAWIPVYGALGLALLAATWRQIAALARRCGRPVALGAAGAVIFLTGAVGLEVLGFYNALPPRLEVVAEEGLEMLGETMMLCAALGIRTALTGAIHAA